jgi:5'-3' exonuclease
VDYAVSKDYDTLVFGAPHLVLDFPVAGDATVVTLATALEDLRLPNREALVDLAIMAGCDFTPKLPKVGPVTAWKAILAHGTIEKAQEARAVPIGPEGFDPDFARARFFGREVVPKPATEAATAPEGAGAAQDAEDAAAPDPSKEEV